MSQEYDPQFYYVIRKIQGKFTGYYYTCIYASVVDEDPSKNWKLSRYDFIENFYTEQEARKMIETILANDKMQQYKGSEFKVVKLKHNKVPRNVEDIKKVKKCVEEIRQGIKKLNKKMSMDALYDILNREIEKKDNMDFPKNEHSSVQLDKFSFEDLEMTRETISTIDYMYRDTGEIFLDIAILYKELDTEIKERSQIRVQKR